jgi:hypothetical protein
MTLSAQMPHMTNEGNRLAFPCHTKRTAKAGLSRSPQPRVLIWREPQENPASARLNRVLQHLPAL